MGSWYYCNLGDAMLAGEALEQIKNQFLSETKHRSIPAGAALYIRHESEGRLHCEVKVYFPPEIAGLARVLGAVPCEQPDRNTLGVLLKAPGTLNK